MFAYAGYVVFVCVVNDRIMNMYLPALRSIAGKCCLYGNK